MFERWADAVAAIPIDDGSHGAASKPARQAQSPLKIDLADHADHADRADQADQADHADAQSAKSVGLRAAMGLVDSELAGLRRKVSFDKTAAPHATVESPVESSAEAGAFMAQIAAFPTREAAESGWARLKQAHPDVLGRLSARFEAVDLGDRGVWTRVLAGPFSSRNEATAVCSGVGAHERGCVVARHG